MSNRSFRHESVFICNLRFGSVVARFFSIPVKTIALPDHLSERLEKVASETSQSIASLAEEAIETYLDQTARIRESIAQLERGEGIPYERLRPWLQNLMAGQRNPSPK